MSAQPSADQRPIIHKGMAWDSRLCVGLFVACVGGPAVMTHPSLWAWIVFGLHILGMIAFYYLAKHIGRRVEREEREAAFGLNQSPVPASDAPAIAKH